MISYGPPESLVALALKVAASSPCRSKRGVVLFNERTGERRGEGFNGPPTPLTCPGRERCAGTCGKRSVHAEVRALRDAAWQRQRFDSLELFDLLHVELGADGGVVACDGPSCWQCAREILDVGFVSGVWLYERAINVGIVSGVIDRSGPERWVRYTAADFYRKSLENCGVRP